jgi:hypothetical protein
VPIFPLAAATFSGRGTKGRHLPFLSRRLNSNAVNSGCLRHPFLGLFPFITRQVDDTLLRFHVGQSGLGIMCKALGNSWQAALETLLMIEE